MADETGNIIGWILVALWASYKLVTIATDIYKTLQEGRRMRKCHYCFEEIQCRHHICPHCKNDPYAMRIHVVNYIPSQDDTTDPA